MIDDDDVAVILCQRLDEPGFPVNGSTVARCRCASQVWVAKSTYDRVPEGAWLEFVCNACVRDEELEAMVSQLQMPDQVTLSMLQELAQHRRDYPQEWK